MGLLVNGEWKDRWYDTDETGGTFERDTSRFRSWVTPDGAPGPSGEGGFAAASGRYHLYVSLACPWAHRTLILRALKGLEPHIGVSVVHPDMMSDGWELRDDHPGATGDRLMGLRYLRDVYLRADPNCSGRVTVPVLWDAERGTIVSNESAEIVRMLNSAFDAITGDDQDFRPEPLRDEIEAVNGPVYDHVNNGVYKAGFATTQEAYDAAVRPLFDTLGDLDRRLAARTFLVGDAPTEADWRLFTTLVRFDAVYHGHFKCNRRRIVDYANLWPYARRLYQWPGVAGTVGFDHITRHYHFSHETVNPHRIVPIGPDVDWEEPVPDAPARAA